MMFMKIFAENVVLWVMVLNAVASNVKRQEPRDKCTGVCMSQQSVVNSQGSN